MKTLEDLKNHLGALFASEWKDKDITVVLELCDNEMKHYQLDSDEHEYVMPIKSTLEEQSNRKTLINSKKASEILLKRKKVNDA